MLSAQKPITIDKFVFSYIKEKLAGASPDQIAAFYVKRFIFGNEGYLEYLQARYKLPNDFLKLHEKICKLAEE